MTEREQLARELIRRVISAYHTTRLIDTPAEIHILSKPHVRQALGDLLREPAEPTQDEVERVGLAVAREIEGPQFDPFADPEAFEFACRIGRAAIVAMLGEGK